MSKIGKEIFRSGSFSIKPASPDAPIYSRGFAIGERRLSNSSSNTQETGSPNKSKPQSSKSGSAKDEKRVPTTLEQDEKELQEWMDKGIYEAARHQMGGSDSSTGRDKKDSKS